MTSKTTAFHVSTDALALGQVDINHSPGPEYSQAVRKWQGIPGIEKAPNERLWAAWYSGGRTEDEFNHVLLVTSGDGGKSWTEPVLVIDPPGHVRAADPVLWHDPNGRLWLFWMQTAIHGAEVFDGRGGVWAICTGNSGDAKPVWSQPRRIANGVMMNKPTVLSTGEWLLPISIWRMRDDEPPRLHNLPEETSSNVFISEDSGGSFRLLGKASIPNSTCDEHMIIERRDGSIWMLVRRKDGIGEAVSNDRGRTWKVSPVPVLPGPNSRFHIRRLKSGRLLLINHHEFSGRNNLTAFLSDDDGKTWPYKLLLDERSLVSYPDAVESEDGRIHIIYDYCRVGDAHIILQTVKEQDIISASTAGHQSGRLVVISSISRANIGSRLELFMDDELIDQKINVSSILHKPERKGVALVADRPWEGRMSGTYVTIFRDGDLLRMYYKALDIMDDFKPDDDPFPHPLYICYAESKDGLNWERPELGIYEFQGSKANNIVFTGFGPRHKERGIHGFSPFLDTNPDCPPDEKYKALGGFGLNATDGDLDAMVSHDGLHWRLMQEEPVMKQHQHGAFDSQQVAFWDTERGEYRAYFRDYINRKDPLLKTRTIKTATSKDFRVWENFEVLEFPGSIQSQLYTSQIEPYYRAPHILIGFPARYTHREWSPVIEALPELDHRKWRREKYMERYGTSLTDGLFMSSRDRRKFYKWDEAFIRPGPQRTGNWFYGDNYQSLGIFETTSELNGAPNELSFLASENSARKPGALFRRFSIRKDGFVSIHADMKGGELTLNPLRFSGKRMILNFSTSAAGSIRVQLETWFGTPIKNFSLDDCLELVGDEIDRHVTWKNWSDVGELSGELVRVRFSMRDADLFSFRFAE